MIDLFNPGLPVNLLPYDGEALYYGKIMPIDAASKYYGLLLKEIEWKQDEAVIYGKHILTKRKVAWYGDEAYHYTYSRTTKQALPWTPALLELKAMTEALCGEMFNSCLLNLYHDGNEGMAYHSDDEKALGKHSAIGSLSFGAERRFLFKHKTSKETVGLTLEHGSMLVMRGTTQTHWLHGLPPALRVKTPRVNLTFRKMV